MPPLVIIDSDSRCLWYHPDKQIVHHQFHQFIWGSDFRELLLAGAELLKKHKARKWLSDDRGMPVLRIEDIQWAQTEWFPSMVQAGWKYWAIVQPEKVIGQINIERLMKEFSAAGIVARYFSDPDEAMHWLESQH